MSEKMLHISQAHLERFTLLDETIAAFCLRKCLSAYVSIRRDLYLVYLHYQAGSGAGFLPLGGFGEDIAFLRLDSVSLADIAVGRTAHLTEFSGDGFSIPRPYRVVWQRIWDQREFRVYEDVESPTLKRVDFDRAYVVDRDKWQAVSSSMAVKDDLLPEKLAITMEVSERNLYFLSSDIDALKKDAQEVRELVPYPFDHKEGMPGLYWIFQIAYLFNEVKGIEKKNVLDRLRGECDEGAFAGKRGGLAVKLVDREWNRSKGRKGGPRPFKVPDLKNWADVPDKYDISFIGDGLKVALAVADWWADRREEDPNISRVQLALKLYAQNFDETEAGHVVRLIAGVQLSRDERNEFEKIRIEMDKKERLKTARSERAQNFV